ncbi:unnamed protein product [Dovyalis caffra]|uniref:Uncharacterized protein n=1 Tax=Dovyalis caffra TaxID=77055 RepID=A0AAV1RDH5_9ROSI|nr:unnamed protein product [Dovyalis caffra]
MIEDLLDFVVIEKLNPDGKKYDKVSRVVARKTLNIDSTLISPHDAQVALTHGPENVKPQVRQTDGNGNFCFESFFDMDVGAEDVIGIAFVQKGY